MPRLGQTLISRLCAAHKVATDLAATGPDILAHPKAARAIGRGGDSGDDC
jgi:hypothetical protein